MTDLTTTAIIDSVYSEEVVKLNSSFAKMIVKKNELLLAQGKTPIKTSMFMPVSSIDSSVYPKIKKLLVEILDFLGIEDKSAPFIKFQIDENGYKGMRFPSIGTVGDKIGLMMGDNFYDITKTWTKKENGKSLRFRPKKKIFVTIDQLKELEKKGCEIKICMAEV